MLFEQTLRELGIDEPGDEQEALWALAQHTARQIVQGHQLTVFVFDDFLGEDNSAEHTFEIFWHIDGNIEESEC